MLIKTIFNALIGACLSITAFYLFVVFFLVKNNVVNSNGFSGSLPDLLFGAPVYALAHFFEWVIPVGLMVGSVLPVLVMKKTRRHALVYGIVIGVIVGLYFAGASAYDFATNSLPANAALYNFKWWERFKSEVISSAPMMVGYSTIWTCGYAFIRTHHPLNTETDNQEEL